MCFSDRKQLFEFKIMKKTSFFFDRKIHKQVGKLRRRLFLQLTETQFTGLRRRRRPPSEIAARWRWVHLFKNMTAHYNCHFCVTFNFVFTGKPKTPINGSKLVLNLSLLFSKVCCFKFLYQACLPSINVWLIRDSVKSRISSCVRWGQKS